MRIWTDSQAILAPTRKQEYSRVIVAQTFHFNNEIQINLLHIYVRNYMEIVATISKNSFGADKIEEILLAGATVLRYNFSHGTPQEMKTKISTAREVITALHLDHHVRILADLPGNKIRLGYIPNGEHFVEKGNIITFASAKETKDPTQFIPVDYPNIGTLVEPNQEITIGDGEIAFIVESTPDADTIVARAQNSRSIPHLKGFNVGRKVDTLNHITPFTKEHISSLSQICPEWVAFSFVNSSDMLREAKSLLAPHLTVDWQPKIVSKVETALGVKHIDEIANESDILLVARGDLGLTCPIEELGLHQKKIITSGKKFNKPVIVSTQILESLLSCHTPSRADVLDLTNIVLDGADGIMLAKETGISSTPGHSVQVAKKIINVVLEAKKHQKESSRESTAMIG